MNMAVIAGPLNGNAIVDKGNFHDEKVRTTSQLIVLYELDRGVSRKSDQWVLNRRGDRLSSPIQLELNALIDSAHSASSDKLAQLIAVIKNHSEQRINCGFQRTILSRVTPIHDF